MSIGVPSLCVINGNCFIEGGNELEYTDVFEYSKKIDRCNHLSTSLNNFRLFLMSDFDSNDQAMKVYYSLDKEILEIIGKTVWIACFHPEGDFNFGNNFLKNNPRFLLECKNVEGKDVLTQIIDHFNAMKSIYQLCDELVKFMFYFKKYTDNKDKLNILNVLSIPLQNKLVESFPVYGEKEIHRNPGVLIIADLESLHRQLKDTASYSLLGQGLEKYSKMRRVPGLPVPTAIENAPGEVVSKKRVVMFSPEISGVITAGGLGSAVEGMARGYGVEWVRVVLPKYDIINSKIEMKEKPKYEIEFNGKIHKVFKAKINGLRCYFIDDPEHFAVGYNEEGKPYKVYDAHSDLAEKRRWLHFQSSAAELGYKLSQKTKNPVEVIHLHDAQTALIPKLIINRHFFEWKARKTPATVFTVHNNLCSMKFDYNEAKKALAEIGLQETPCIAFVEGIECSEMVVPVSKQFASEFQTERFGNGLERYTKIAAMDGRVVGITNGNTVGWDPRKDMQLKNWRTLDGRQMDLTYGPDDPDLSNKLMLIRRELVAYLKYHFQAKFDPERPIFFYVGRYDSYQKGIDKLPLIMGEILKNNGQFICIGTEPDAQAGLFLKEMEETAELYNRIGVLIIRDYKRQDNRLHWQQGNVSLDDHSGVQGFGSLLRAGVDIGIFPSMFEPCGLVQGEMHRMGKKTAATNVGGFVDTIFTSGLHFNGYLFERHDWSSSEQISAIGDTIRKAARDSHGALKALYKNDQTGLQPHLEQMRAIMRNALQSTWTSTFDGSLSPSESYNLVYDKAVRNKEKRGTVFVDIFPLKT